MFQRTLRDATEQMDQHTLAIWMPAHLQYLLITVKCVALEKVSFSDTQIPEAVCQNIACQWQTFSA